MLNRKNSTEKLGASNLEISPIAYGFWRFAGTDVQTALTKVETALEMGITLMDHADIYGLDGDGQFGDAEELFGAVLKAAPHLRDRMVLATKGGIMPPLPYDSSNEYLTAALERSLTRLNVEVIDLYQIHRPDFLTHPAVLAETLTRFRNEGKVKEFGVSNYTAAQTAALQAHLDFPLVSVQPEFSVHCTDPLRDGVLDQAMAFGMTPLAWSPLGGGRIGMTLNDAKAVDDQQRTYHVLSVLDRVANEQSVPRVAVALAWILAHPAGVVPILGTQRPERIRESMRAFDVKLTRQTWNEILVASQGYPLP